MFTESLTQGLSVCDTLNATQINNTTGSTLGVDMSHFKRIFYQCTQWGLQSALNASVSYGLQTSPNSNFNVVHTYPGSNTTNQNTNYVITTLEVRADQIAYQNPGDRYVRCQATGAGGLVNTAIIGLGGQSIQSPASQYNLSSTWLGTQFVG